MSLRDNLPTISNIRDFIKSWNNEFPIDYWWRRKYHIPFGTSQHLETPLIYMRVQYEEDYLLKKEEDSKKEKEEGGEPDIFEVTDFIGPPFYDDQEGSDIRELNFEDLVEEIGPDGKLTLTLR